MTKIDFLEKLKLSGITTIQNNDIGDNVIECLPSYRKNFGFFHILGKGFEAIILKGVYKDYLRLLKGNPDINQSYWDEIAKTLNDAESVVNYSIFKISLSANEARIFSCEPCDEKPNFQKDMRDYEIPRPLTSTEYEAPSSYMIDDNAILSQKFITYLFPQVLTPLSISIAEKIPNVLNPIFMSCNLKTDTPSIVNIYGRPYTNLTAMEKIFKTIGIGSSFFRHNFAPNLYIKNKSKPQAVNIKYFPVEDDEITEILSELKEDVTKITLESLMEDKYVEFYVNFAVVAEFLFVKIASLTANLMKYYADYSLLLEAIFKSRSNSIFYTDNEIDLPTHFDFVADFVSVKFNLEKNIQPIDNIIKKLPFSKKFMSKGKIKALIKEVHKYLDLRDELYLISVEFLKNSQLVLNNLADFLLKKELIKDKNDIYFFEHSELKKLVDNNFVGNSFDTVNYRKRLFYRQNAAILPTEIYGKDLSESGKIAESMLIKSLSAESFQVLSLFYKDKVSETCYIHDDFTDNSFVVADNISVCHLDKYKNSKGFILELNPLFSFTSEYACLNNIPVFYGVRYAPLLLNNRLIEATENKIKFI